MTLARPLSAPAAIAALCVLIACAGETPSGSSGTDHQADGPEAVAAAIDSDRVRLRRHFDAVLAELSSADVSHLSADQRAARAGHIAELRRYRDRGVYPHNHDFPGLATPYFVDEHGTRCALGHLIEESGGGELVERIASTRNNAFVAELKSDGQLVAWLDRAGLSAAEAARIQPTYCNGSPGPCPPEEEISAAYGMVSLGVNISNFTTIVLNMTPSGRTRGWFGVVGGTIGLALGITKLDESGAVRTLGAVNTSMGLLSLALGIYGVRNSDVAPRKVLRTSLGDVSIAPVVSAGTIGLRGEF